MEPAVGFGSSDIFEAVHVPTNKKHWIAKSDGSGGPDRARSDPAPARCPVKNLGDEMRWKKSMSQDILGLRVVRRLSERMMRGKNEPRNHAVTTHWFWMASSPKEPLA